VSELQAVVVSGLIGLGMGDRGGFPKKVKVIMAKDKIFSNLV
jgi:hypothetical protein